MPARAERLLDLLQSLRARRVPVAAGTLASELGVSLRTLYRDIQSLRAQGADIAGEAGIGYLLRPGFLLPPLMFSPEELDALALGARWVQRNGDSALAEAAARAIVKIAAVAPKDSGEFLDAPTQLTPPRNADRGREDEWLPRLREAMRAERRVGVDYIDAKGRPSRRIVWPVAVGFFGDVRMVAAWCETRGAFRHFRVDRIAGLDLLPERFPKRRRALLAEWRKAEGIVINARDADIS